MPYRNGITYTQAEYSDMRNFLLAELKKEQEKNRRANEMIENLTLQLCKKNKEIEKLNFYVEALTKGMLVAGETIREIRKSLRDNRSGK